jgi:hypothetical protein
MSFFSLTLSSLILSHGHNFFLKPTRDYSGDDGRYSHAEAGSLGPELKKREPVL